MVVVMVMVMVVAALDQVDSLRLQMGHAIDVDVDDLSLETDHVVDVVGVGGQLLNLLFDGREPLVDVYKLLLDAARRGMAEGADIRAVVLRHGRTGI